MPHNLNRMLKDAERVQYKKSFFFFNASILLKIDIVIISLIVIFCI